MIRPPFLQLHDKVVIISPAGKILSTYVNNTISILEEWGLNVKLSENALRENGRFSGFVEQRYEDLQAAMDDPEVKLIFCSRGGYGAIHLLDRLNFEGIKKNPKWIVGFSDITALHAAFLRNGIMSIHAPMSEHFSKEGAKDLSVLYTKAALSGKSLDYTIPSEYPYLNREGKVTGTVFGGNLSVYAGMLGSKFTRIPRNGIFFLEEIGEKPYRVDRMIYQLKLAGFFDKIKGLIIGQFTDYEEDNEMYTTLYESILSAVKEFSFPVCFGFPVGHVKINLPMIVGGNATLTVKRDIILLKQRY